jgi:hypothetical protein
MPRFRKRPVEVEAEQFLPEYLPFRDRGPYVRFDPGIIEFFVVTVHGQRTPIAFGDWIILETHGKPEEFQAYPCKPDIFLATYEPVKTKPLPLVPKWYVPFEPGPIQFTAIKRETARRGLQYGPQSTPLHFSWDTQCNEYIDDGRWIEVTEDEAMARIKQGNPTA